MRRVLAQPVCHQRQIHRRSVTTTESVDVHELVILCPLSMKTTLKECLRCKDNAGRSLEGGRDRSFVMCRAGTARGPRDPEPLLAAVMTEQAEFVADDLPVAALRLLLASRGEESLMAVDSKRLAVGLVSARELEGVAQPELLVRDVMRRTSLRVSARSTVRQTAALMASTNTSCLAVVADDDEVVGVVTALDLVRWMAARAGSATP